MLLIPSGPWTVHGRTIRAGEVVIAKIMDEELRELYEPEILGRDDAVPHPVMASDICRAVALVPQMIETLRRIEAHEYRYIESASYLEAKRMLERLEAEE